MHNSQYGTGPSKEWQSYGAAHPELNIDADGRTNDNAVALRSTTNDARNASSRALFARDNLSSEVTIKDYDVPTRDGSTITARVYRPTDREDRKPLEVYIFYHGGGFLFGTTDSEDYACANWALATGVAVVHVCYRHTPEFVFPTQHDDAWDGFEWVLANGEMLGVDVSDVVVGGISAGGTLAAAVVFQEVQLARREGRKVRVKGQLLAIPWLIHRDNYPWELFASREKASLSQCAESPILPKERYDLFTDLLKVADPQDPRMNVGLADEEDLRGMPRTVFMVNGWDLLRDDGFIYADKLERVRVPAKKHVFPGLPHAFRRWPDLPSSQRWDAVTLDSIRWCLDEGAPGDHVGSWSIEAPES